MGGEDMSWAMGLAAIVGGVIASVSLFAASEAIGVVLAIEENTRRTPPRPRWACCRAIGQRLRERPVQV